MATLAERDTYSGDECTLVFVLRLAACRLQCFNERLMNGLSIPCDDLQVECFAFCVHKFNFVRKNY